MSNYLSPIQIMQTGVIKFFNVKKGYGFVKEDGSEKEYFVHATGLIDRIRENDTVEFEVKEGDRGASAVNVKKI
jgi:CspA family cold shock protein